MKIQVAKDFVPQWTSWSSPEQVAPDSATSEQLSLMQSLVDGDLPADSFARAWLGARRRALADGERVRGGLATALDRVFFDLDDYVIDPSLRDPDDMSDAELRSRVRLTMEELTSATR
jgi:hypothetical protein